MVWFQTSNSYLYKYGTYTLRMYHMNFVVLNSENVKLANVVIQGSEFDEQTPKMIFKWSYCYIAIYNNNNTELRTIHSITKLLSMWESLQEPANFLHKHTHTYIRSRMYLCLQLQIYSQNILECCSAILLPVFINL